MGFPVGYSELPKLLLHLLFLLAHLRKVINWVFQSLGLSSLLDAETSWHDVNVHGHHHLGGLCSIPTELIQESLPVIRFGDLLLAEGDAGARFLPETCAVCLSELEGAHEVRRMNNCRHVFHQWCVDRWLEHGQRTCPLCRAPLVTDDLQHRARASSSDVDGSSYGGDDDYYYSLASPSASLLRPLQFPSS